MNSLSLPSLSSVPSVPAAVTMAALALTPGCQDPILGEPIGVKDELCFLEQESRGGSLEAEFYFGDWVTIAVRDILEAEPVKVSAWAENLEGEETFFEPCYANGLQVMAEEVGDLLRVSASVVNRTSQEVQSEWQLEFPDEVYTSQSFYGDNELYKIGCFPEYTYGGNFAVAEQDAESVPNVGEDCFAKFMVQ